MKITISEALLVYGCFITIFLFEIVNKILSPFNICFGCLLCFIYNYGFTKKKHIKIA